MAQFRTGVEVAANYSFTIIKRGSTQGRTFIFQSHDYDDGGVEEKELKVGAGTVTQPMQTKNGTHSCKFLIPEAEAQAYIDELPSNTIVDSAIMPSWKAEKGPHYVSSCKVTDTIDGESTLEVEIKESNGGIGAAS